MSVLPEPIRLNRLAQRVGSISNFGTQKFARNRAGSDLRHQLHNLLPQANGVALAPLRNLDREFGDHHHGRIIAIHKPQLLESAFERGSNGLNFFRAKYSRFARQKGTTRHANNPAAAGK
jgi:hypothetical protein